MAEDGQAGSGRIREVLAGIDRRELLDLLMGLLSIESHKGHPGQEKDVALFIESWLRSQGIPVQLREVCGGRPNVIATLPGTRIGGGEPSGAATRGRSLMLNGHLDTVLPSGLGAGPSVRDGLVIGRGAVDMKGAISAMLIAMAAVKRSSLTLAGDLVFTGVIDEEEGSLGSEEIVRNGPRTDAVICGEPTSLKVGIALKGLEWLEVSLRGRAAHGGTPEKGVNAIEQAAVLIDRIRRKLLPALRGKRHPLLGGPTLNIGLIEGGNQINIVPDHCVFQIDRRTIPGETRQSVLVEIRQLIEEIAAVDGSFSAAVEPIEGLVSRLGNSPMEIAADHELVKTLLNCVSGVTGHPGEVYAFPVWADAALFANNAGIPSVLLGPGDLGLAHTDEEWVDPDEVYQAACVYARAALAICL